MPAQPVTDLTLLYRILREAAPYRWQVLALFVLGLLATPISLLAPFPLKLAVDNVVGSKPAPHFLATLLPESVARSPEALLGVAVALVVLISLLSHLQWAASWLLSTSIGERLVLSFRARMFQHVQRLSLAYHDSRGSTDATYRVQYDAPAIQWIVIDSLIPLASSLLKVIGMLWVMFLLDASIAWLALAIVPVLYTLTTYYRRQVRPQWREVKTLESSAMSIVQEVIGALRVVKAFGQEDQEQDRFLQQSDRTVDARLRVTRWECLFGILIGLTTAAGTASVLWLGVSHVREGALTLGELLVVMAYLGQLYEPLKSLSKNVTGLQKSLASAERALELIDEVPDVVERPHARPLQRAQGAFRCEAVSFSYPGQAAVLQGVTFEVPPGTRVGIIGPTGAGKTTLINLLTRLYDPDAGAILLDGCDLRDYRLADLRRQFAIVMQEPVLLSTTIAQNIAYARPEAAQSEIISAARAANADEFIRQMSDGYATRVGERGLRLSGGERQRISIARAFLRDAPILVLDEPTSSVDGRTEAGIMEAMERLMQGRTTFMIAHRLSTLRHCDLLLRIDAGQVVEQTSAVAQVLAAEQRSWDRPAAYLAAKSGE